MRDAKKTKTRIVSEMEALARMAPHEISLLQGILENLPVPYILVDTHERVIKTNQSFLDMLEINKSIDGCYGKTLAEIYYNDPTHDTYVGRSIREGLAFKNVEVNTLSRGGVQRVILANISPLYDAEGVCIGGLCLYIDMTEQKKIEQALRESEKRYKLLAENTEDAIFTVDNSLRITYVSPSLQRLFNMAPDEVMGADSLSLIAPRSRQSLVAAHERRMQDEARGEYRSDRLEVEGQRKDGSTVWLEMVTCRLFDDQGRPSDIIGVAREITARKRTEEALRAEVKRNQILLETSIHGIHVLDTNGKLVLCSPSFSKMLGYSPEEMAGLGVSDWTIPPQGQEPTPFVADSFLQAMFFETRFRRKDGSVFDVEIAARSVELDGRILIYNSALDITRRKQMEQELERLAYSDALTGLANRRHFMELAELELSRAVRYGNRLSILLMDVDHFKSINDTHGHHVGDLALQKLGGLCREKLRNIDTAGRIGGEEFAVLLPQTGGKEAVLTAERLRKAVAKAETPLGEGAFMRFTVSIGVATLGGTSEGIDALLERADKALYKAKRDGRNRVRVEHSSGPSHGE
ncbi:MAG: PAS domain S-box protein [Thermodesulfobacteriota bacterium]